jgi:hypothetical protein
MKGRGGIGELNEKNRGGEEEGYWEEGRRGGYEEEGKRDK